MRKRAIAAILAAAAAGYIFLGAPNAVGQAGDSAAPIRILASDGVKPAVEALLPQIERAAGRKVSTQFDSSKRLGEEIQGGATFDVAILTSEGIDALIQQGKIATATRSKIARSGMGVGVRAGAAKPDIGTPEAMKKALLAAKSITFNPTGASAAHFNEALMKLGIVDEVKPKFILEQEPARAQMDVADGKAEIVITLVPEILDSKGVELAGPFPRALQSYIEFAAGAAANSHYAEAAKAAIKLIAGPAAASTFKAKGLEPR